MPLPNATPSTAAQSRVQHYAAKALVMLALLALGGVVWKVREVFHARQAQERHYAESELHIINQWQAESVAKWRNQRLADAMALSEDALLAKALAQWRAAPSPTNELLLTERLRVEIQLALHALAFLTQRMPQHILAGREHAQQHACQHDENGPEKTAAL